MADHIHIIAFNIPYPADYGGVIDVFYRIKSIAEQGQKIHLHCFEYGREQSDELNKYCEKVYYYKREKKLADFFHYLPFIVLSRRNEALLNNLLKDDAPVFFEGLHSCYYISDKRLASRLKLVRAHNIEHRYYFYLSYSEKNILKKLFFLLEFIKLFFFQTFLKFANHIFGIAPDEVEYFQKHFKKVSYLPAFHPHNEVETLAGQGKYALYHGDLSVQENEQAALFLAKKIFNKLDYPLIIAGKKPGKRLKKELETSGIQLVDTPDDEQMKSLIREAQLHVLPTFQPTGIKLKLLNVLFNGRHCIVNQDMVKNSGLESLCHIASDADDMIRLVQKYISIPFAEEEMQKRKNLLEHHFNNQKNAAIVLSCLK